MAATLGSGGEMQTGGGTRTPGVVSRQHNDSERVQAGSPHHHAEPVVQAEGRHHKVLAGLDGEGLRGDRLPQPETGPELAGGLHDGRNGAEGVPVVAVGGKRPVSARRLAANRANALKSTGPRTEAGKRRSSQNARKSTGPRSARGKSASKRNGFKHGYWALEPVRPEEMAAFAAQVRAFAEDQNLNPPGLSAEAVHFRSIEAAVLSLVEHRLRARQYAELMGPCSVEAFLKVLDRDEPIEARLRARQDRLFGYRRPRRAKRRALKRSEAMEVGAPSIGGTGVVGASPGSAAVPAAEGVEACGYEVTPGATSVATSVNGVTRAGDRVAGGTPALPGEALNAVGRPGSTAVPAADEAHCAETK